MPEAKTANIYRTARMTAGLTQERWSEMLGVSPEAVRQYEAGTFLPADEIARRMAELAGMPVLAYWHLCRKSTLAASLLPQVEDVPLPQAVCRLLAAVGAWTHNQGSDRLLQIAADGRVDELEEAGFRQILADLDEIVRAALQVKFSEDKEEGTL